MTLLRYWLLVAALAVAAGVASAVPFPGNNAFPGRSGQAHRAVFWLNDAAFDTDDGNCLVTGHQSGVSLNCVNAVNVEETAHPVTGVVVGRRIICSHGDINGAGGSTTWDAADTVTLSVAASEHDGATVRNIGSTVTLTGATGGGDVEITADGQGWAFDNVFTDTLTADESMVLRITAAVDADASARLNVSCAVEFAYSPS
jgi:hypothetical protein